MGIKKPYQKCFELGASVRNYTIKFVAANRQFDWLEVSLVTDKSTIYNSYNQELASMSTQIIAIQNMSNKYSITNELNYDK